MASEAAKKCARFPNFGSVLPTRPTAVRPRASHSSQNHCKSMERVKGIERRESLIWLIIWLLQPVEVSHEAFTEFSLNLYVAKWKGYGCCLLPF